MFKVFFTNTPTNLNHIGQRDSVTQDGHFGVVIILTHPAHPHFMMIFCLGLRCGSRAYAMVGYYAFRTCPEPIQLLRLHPDTTPLGDPETSVREALRTRCST